MEEINETPEFFNFALSIQRGSGKYCQEQAIHLTVS
jgi:hypothetical protein